MVARTRTEHQELTVTFQRDGEQPEHISRAAPRRRGTTRSYSSAEAMRCIRRTA